jgi:hypothetical protein
MTRWQPAIAHCQHRTTCGVPDRCRPTPTSAPQARIPTDIRDRGFDVGRYMGHPDDKPIDISEANTIARCRELLGDEAAGMSDQEIDQIRRHANAMAHVIVEMLLNQRDAQE